MHAFAIDCLEMTLTDFAHACLVTATVEATGKRHETYTTAYGQFSDTQSCYRLTVKRHAPGTRFETPEDRRYAALYGRPVASFVMEYTQGSGVTGKPTTETALDCAVVDASVAESYRDVYEMAQEFGYEMDTRAGHAEALRIFDACCERQRQLKEMFNEAEYETLMYHTERL